MFVRRWAAACVALLGPACLARAAAPLPEFPSPATTPVEAIREQFEATASPRAYDEGRNAVEKVSDADQHRKVDAAACRSHAAELDAAARHDPLGLAVWYYKERCADALGDASLAAQNEKNFVAVLRDTLQGIPPDNGQTPIPLGSMADGVALMDASGETMTYSYIDISRIADGIVWRVGLRDESGAHQRNLSFDLTGPRLRLVHSPQATRSPFVRVSAWLDATRDWQAEARKGDGMPVTLDGLDREPAAVRTARIKREAADDHLSDAIVLARYCFERPKEACTAAAVDNLLTFAEQGHAEAMVLLAYAYTNVDGFKHDEESAKALMLGAGRKMGVGAAFQEYSYLGRASFDKASDFVRWAFAQLVAAADGGDPLAASMVLRVAAQVPAVDTDPARVERYRRQVETAGLGLSSHRYAMAGSTKAGGGPLQMKSAEAILGSTRWGSERAAVAKVMAWAYQTGKVQGVAADPARAMHWHQVAGMLGDVSSMLYVARRYADEGERADAMGLAAEWYSSAVLLGDVDANLEMARVAERSPKGFGIATPDGGLVALEAKDAADIYREIDQQLPDSRAGRVARRRLARMMVDGRGTPRDPDKARAMLAKDAEAGDGEAALVLAAALYAGDFGARDPAGAKQWIDKALAKPDKAVATRLAGGLFRGVELPLDRARAIELWTQAGGQGFLTAWNDMGWELCTAADAAARDPRRGLEAVRRAMTDDAPAGFIDSLAACQAATGDFAGAVATQQRALALPDPASTMAARMRERLDLYKAHRAYVQSPDVPMAMPVARPEGAPPGTG